VKAKILALGMHKLFQNFVIEMCTWMDSFYQELVITSEATTEEAWEVMGTCIKNSGGERYYGSKSYQSLHYLPVGVGAGA